MGDQLVDELIHGSAGLDHHHDLPGLLQVLHQLLDGVGADDVLTGSPALHKVLHLLGGTVVYGHGEALGLHVHYQVFHP